MSIELKVDKLLESAAATKVHVEYIRENLEKQTQKVSKLEQDIEELKKWKWREAGFLAAIVIVGKLVWHSVSSIFP